MRGGSRRRSDPGAHRVELRVDRSRRTRSLRAHGLRSRERRMISTVVVALTLIGAEEIDFSALASMAVSSSPRLVSAALRSTADIESYSILEPSPFPTIRAGARLWPSGSPNDPTDQGANARWRLYTQL